MTSNRRVIKVTLNPIADAALIEALEPYPARLRARRLRELALAGLAGLAGAPAPGRGLAVDGPADIGRPPPPLPPEAGPAASPPARSVRKPQAEAKKPLPAPEAAVAPAPKATKEEKEEKDGAGLDAVSSLMDAF